MPMKREGLTDWTEKPNEMLFVRATLQTDVSSRNASCKH